MKTYKAPDNSIHVIEPKFAHFLPAGCVEISDEEAETIRAAINAPTIEQIAAMRNEALKRLRDMREIALNRLIGIAFVAKDENDQSTVDAVKQARVNLLNITQNLPSDPALIEQEVKNRWFAAAYQLQLSAPAAVSAFVGLDM